MEDYQTTSLQTTDGAFFYFVFFSRRHFISPYILFLCLTFFDGIATFGTSTNSMILVCLSYDVCIFCILSSVWLLVIIIHYSLYCTKHR